MKVSLSFGEAFSENLISKWVKFAANGKESLFFVGFVCFLH